MLIFLTFKRTGTQDIVVCLYDPLWKSPPLSTVFICERQIEKQFMTLHFLIKCVLPCPHPPLKLSVFTPMCLCSNLFPCHVAHDQVMRMVHGSGTFFSDFPFFPFFSHFLAHKSSLTARRKWENKSRLPYFHTNLKAIEILYYLRCICLYCLCWLRTWYVKEVCPADRVIQIPWRVSLMVE